MPNQEYALMMARYNWWQNERMLDAVSQLSVAERQKDRGAFFGSIENTLSHLLWGDMVWMSRFEGTAEPLASLPESVSIIKNWDGFLEDRKGMDQRILDWAHAVDNAWFDGDISWLSAVAGRVVQKPRKLLVIQLFNHQTHHRGQVHAMLTAAGVKTDDTDLPFMPDHMMTL